MKNFTLLLFIMLAVGTIVSCKKLEDVPTPVDRLKSIILGKDTLSVYAGEKRQVPITISPANYSTDSILWKSSDTTILSISKLGLITAKKPGISIVSVSNLIKSIAVSCKVLVKDSLQYGLLAYYPFNNSGADSSGNGNDVAYYSNITSTSNRFGKPNSAFYFNGVSSYMTVNDNQALRLNNTDITMNLWINLAVYNNSYGTEILVKRGPGSTNGWNYGITGYANQANNIMLGVTSFQVSGANDPLALGTKAITLNQWHMLSVVYNFQKRQISNYIDGALDNVVNNIPSPIANANDDLFIGQDSQSANSTAYFLKGKLDDVRIYNRILTAKEIQKLFSNVNQ